MVRHAWYEVPEEGVRISYGKPCFVLRYQGRGLELVMVSRAWY